MDCSMPGFLVLPYLLEFTQAHVHQWCHPTISSSTAPFSSCLQSFPASWSFLMSQFFALGGQSIRASASSIELPMNIKEWLPLGSIGLIFVQSKELSRVFSSTTIQKRQFFGTQPSLQCSVHDYWETTALTRGTCVGKVMSLLFKTLSTFVIAFLPRSSVF